MYRQTYPDLTETTNHRESYGTVKIGIQQPVETRNLIYTWDNLDVFGEVASQPSNGGLCTRMRQCFSGKNRTPMRTRKHLLKNVSGYARSGELLAILGSSGAGKTTLLNTLAFRSPTGIHVSSSSVRALNGVPLTASDLRARCAYVQQDDLFIGSLSAREHLIFQALLRMDKDIPYKQKLARVDEVIRELSLTKCQNTVIGIPGRIKGLSGGEKKRLSFASEALIDPPLLLCDEPTSGLDSFIAHNVIQVLKNVVEKGKIVILTIHQPSSELYSMFDKLLLMANGRVAFYGTPAQASQFFMSVGRPCPPNYNPADHFIQVLAIQSHHEEESRESITKICDAYDRDEIASDVKKTIKDQKCNDGLPVMIDGGVMRYRAPWMVQIRAILWRSWISMIKDPILMNVRLFQTVTVSFLIGLIFFQQKLDETGVMNINGAIFLFLTNMTFQNVFAVINVFTGELPVFLRETRSHLYRPDTFFLGKTLSELPLFIVIPIIFTAVAYPMVGLIGGFYHFFIASCIMALMANAATSYGYLISSISSSTSMALSIGPPVVIPFLLFGGFFLNSASVPFYFSWLSYLSWFRYANEALLINQWAEVEPGEIACNRANISCPASGTIVLETLNFSEDNFMLDIGGLVFLLIFFRFLAFLALYYKARSKE
ncbi:protein white isoform X2 [Lutzomyia longipalpis]|uniref:protein white isoform X2 n=1 Tax=Lutzomyia longipalpis TaxID=7200 RepID=UPI002483E994|nr:protein white isoform X2 [Lutzomyia longipalpis]